MSWILPCSMLDPVEPVANTLDPVEPVANTDFRFVSTLFIIPRLDDTLKRSRSVFELL